MNEVIDAVTAAMSGLFRDGDMTHTLDIAAYEHLRDARRLLIAKYQPEEGGGE